MKYLKLAKTVLTNLTESSMSLSSTLNGSRDLLKTLLLMMQCSTPKSRPKQNAKYLTERPGPVIFERMDLDIDELMELEDQLRFINSTFKLVS